MPSMHAKNVHKIDYQSLKRMGITVLLFDVDDSLLGYYAKKFPDEIVNLFSKLKKSKFQLMLVSNTAFLFWNRSDRLQKLADSVGIEAISLEGRHHLKPKPSGPNEAMRLMGALPSQTAFIGDDANRDMAAAYRAGIQCRILVRPICRHPWWQYILFPRSRFYDVLVWWVSTITDS